MTQLVTRVPQELVDAMDRELIEHGVVANRSEAVRLALERLVDTERRRRIGEQIVEGYQRIPQTDDDEFAAWGEASARRMIEEEPW